nr:BamA/TamA family outer membrane protein [Geobacter sp. DSM 9736]
MHPYLIILLILTVLLSGCTNMVPRKKLPPPLTNDQFDDQVKVVTIPLPVFASSPNEGITYGALTAFLLHNKKDEVSTLLAPQVNLNKNFGTTFSLFGAGYPSASRSWEFNLSRSTNVNEDYELKLRDKTFFNEKLETNLFVFGLTDGSARFFGFQSKSRKDDETNYGDREFGVNLSLGYDLAKNLQVVAGNRLKSVSIVPGAVKTLPYIRDRFTPQDVPGLDGFTVHAQRLSLVYSTLEPRDLPEDGLMARGTIEISSPMLGSTAGYRHYEVEVKKYLPHNNGRFTGVGRLSYNQTLGSNVPFLERSILGGETTLRGYGRNRFIDSSYVLCNLEERIRLFRWAVFDVTTDWEIAPFVDLGAVMESFPEVSSKSFEFNPGIGFRAVVRPNIVGRVDLGVGKEGPAVFVGLGYPF